MTKHRRYHTVIMKQNTQSGELNPLVIPLVLLLIIALGTSAFGIWSYLQYTAQRDNVEGIVAGEVATAKQQQQEEDQKVFAEREKEPYRQFVGPDDLGRVEFSYPKTWSAYVNKGGRGGNYEAIFHPNRVHPVSDRQPYALRVVVQPRSYETIVNSYRGKVDQGQLRSDAATINGFNGVRLTGKLSEQVPNGTIVLFKVRDKTLSFTTESSEFFPDFNNIILENLRFNP